MAQHKELVKYGIYATVAYLVYKNVLPALESKVSGLTNSLVNGVTGNSWGNVATVNNPSGTPAYLLGNNTPIAVQAINQPNGPANVITPIDYQIGQTIPKPVSSPIGRPIAVNPIAVNPTPIDLGVSYNSNTNSPTTVIPTYNTNGYLLASGDNINVAANKANTNSLNYITGDDRTKLIAQTSVQLLPGQFVLAPPMSFNNWLASYNKSKGLNLHLTANDVGLTGNPTMTIDNFISAINSKFPNPTLAGLGYLGLQQNNGWFGVI